jgi:hypothetical protein
MATGNRISGPVSAHVFDMPTGNEEPTRLFVFGDAHNSFENLCAPCDAADGCVDIVEFVRLAVGDAKLRGRALDVFMEMPYVMRDGPSRRSWLASLDALMHRDPKGALQLPKKMP